MLEHCKKCERTTAHVDGVCQRCKFLAEHKTSKAMDPETKKKLRELSLWRRGKRATDPRLDEEKK